jgi:hypothetical protein
VADLVETPLLSPDCHPTATRTVPESSIYYTTDKGLTNLMEQSHRESINLLERKIFNKSSAIHGSYISIIHNI